MRIITVSVATLAAAMVCADASAHHSFAIFFGGDKTVEVSGVVKEFAFANPHGVITVETKDAGGKTAVWKAETNAPSLMRRRGWAKDSLKAGDKIVMDGWPARDGSNYMRMRKVMKDGKQVGVPLESLQAN